ncbi:MAG: hypothetical protein JF563_01880 [Acidobacteriales bacterium]|nr:hypothetical protein [Terriglobales bacterium]
MTEEELQRALASANLTAAQKATVILWKEAQSGSAGMTPYGLSKRMLELRLGNPNRTQLEKDLKRSSDVIKAGKLFQIKAGRTEYVRSLIRGVEDKPIVDLSSAYIPEEIWKGTRNYIEKIAIQLCGCWEQHFYDAAAVMLRRLAETLIIESYETLGREGEIKDVDDNYFMLGKLVDKACSAGGLNLGREAKTALKEIKEHGDRSAHNRRINAVRPELQDIRTRARTAIEELINIARLKR